MTTVLPSPTAQDDAELVSASRGGDRDAFGRIVRRYQGMISGLIYASCGDLQRSEDLAQETFISAWKSLSGLREPAKLPAWLCQIARHRTQDGFRKSTAEKTAVAGFWSRVRETPAPPDQQLIEKEEQAVVWRALAELAQPYRETLVLYYRQGRSTEQVAAAMEISEQAVRQRLARGREMLREQVSEVIERNLQATTPSPAFAVAVMTALPSATSVATATGATTVAKGSLATSPGWLATLAPYIGLIGGVGGGVAGSWAAMRANRTAAERKLTTRFMIKLWLVVALLFPASGAINRLHVQRHWDDRTYITALSIMYALAWGAIATVVLRYQSQSKRLGNPGRPLPELSLLMSVVMAVGPCVGGLSWLIRLALETQDYVVAGIFLGAILAFSTCVLYTIRAGFKFTMLVETIGFAGIIAAACAWRLDLWVANLRNLNPAAVHLPMWPIYACCAGLVVWVAVVMLFLHRPVRSTTEHDVARMTHEQ